MRASLLEKARAEQRHCVLRRARRGAGTGDLGGAVGDGGIDSEADSLACKIPSTATSYLPAHPRGISKPPGPSLH